MSPKIAPMGFSTAAEAAWFEQEVNPEQLGFLERPTNQRRVLIVFAAAFLVIGSVLGVARATTSSPRGPQAAAALAPAPLALASKKPAPAATKARTAVKPVAKVAPATKQTTAKRTVRGKTPAKAAPRKATRSGRSTRNARHK